MSGPDVCQPKGLVYQLENLWMQLALSVIPGWTTPSGAVSHSSALFGLISSPSCPRVVPHLVCVLFPYPIHLPPSCSPSLPIFFFVPSHPLGFPLRVPSHLSPSVVPSTDALSFSQGLTCLGLFFLKPFRAPPASRPRTATNTTVDANCSATNVCRPPPAPLGVVQPGMTERANCTQRFSSW